MRKDDHVNMTSTTAPTGQRRDTHDDNNNNNNNDDERNGSGGDTMRMDGGSGSSWGV